MPAIWLLEVNFNMLKLSHIPLSQSGVLNKLLKDYTDKKENLLPFYGSFPDINGFTTAINNNSYASLNRDVLVRALTQQATLVKNTSEKSLANISSLKENITYTVTTGHQLCLFTGPLYFIYKIISVINLAEELSTNFPGKKFVPVYWMASEDHDFEEVSSFNLFGKTVKWNSSQTGAVGDFKTAELSEILPFVKETFGTSENGIYLSSLFERAYLSHNTLSDATRFIVNELFGDYGLVTIDGNDKILKSIFKNQFRNDIFENVSYNYVSETIARLEKMGYNAQVTPRPINCFYKDEGLRARIEKENDSFKVVGTEITFTKKQLEDIIENTPEKLSPNVVLRPLYQQTILPNISYTGGPGELAYWLQYKTMFDAYKAFFPILTPRAFVTVADKSTKSKIEKLGFDITDFYKDEQELIKQFQVNSNNIFELDNEKKTLETLYASISKKIAAIDKTLVNSVMAEQQKTLNSLDTLSGKTNRALKQKSDTEINQIKSVKEKLFPTGIPQERFDNFAAYYTKWGRDFIQFLKVGISPLSLQQHIISEE